MTSIPEGRREAARRVGKMLATPDGRRQLTASRRPQGRTIVPAEWHEPVGDVLDRVVEHSHPATIAILRGDDLVLLQIKPGRAGVRGVDSASPRSTIGMLYQALEQSDRRSLTFRITEWNAVTASPIRCNA